jgi:hypothetical protein
MALSLGSRKFGTEERELARVLLLLEQLEEPVCQYQSPCYGDNYHQGNYKESNSYKHDFKQVRPHNAKGSLTAIYWTWSVAI